jgi:hypothetical protein
MARHKYEPLPIDDLEAIIRSAGGYVRASRDLRPRVLEAARSQRTERRGRLAIRAAASVLIALTMLSNSLSPRAGQLTFARNGRPFPSTSHELFLRAHALSGLGGDLGWGIVEAFRERSSDQSAALKAEL